MSRGAALYARLPLPLQHSAVSAYGLYRYWLRFGPGFRGFLEEFQQRERFRPDQWKAWQQKRLAHLLSAAATRVPYYRRTWTDGEKADARDGRLEGLPLLDKEPIRVDPVAFLREDLRAWPRIVFSTSGSTGTPIATYWTRQEVRRALALREARSARWAGVSFVLPRATFSGRLVEPDPASRGPFYRFNAVERQVYLSPYHLRAATAPFYVEALARHRIRWLTGYAFSWYLLATLILDQGLAAPPLDAVITTSEKVTPEMRSVMTAAYRCRVYEEYSTVESALFAGECTEGRLHLSPDAGVVEILRPDGSPCQPGEVGEVVATSLMRDYQPFVRYRLGDLAAWDPEPCPCGRAMPILKEVVGRIEDAVVGPDGRQMVRFHGIFVDQPNVREGQVIQETLRRIRVRVSVTERFGPDDVADIIHRMHQRLGDGVEVIVEPVEHIPRTAAGKFRAVISGLSVNDGAAHAPAAPPPLVSVIMPVRNEAAYIQRSLEAVLGQAYPVDRLEVLIVDGMSEDDTRGIVRRAVQRRGSRAAPVVILDNPARIVPVALNLGLRAARGQIIIRVDGHCAIAPDYVAQCVGHLAATGADCVGGPIETVGETPAARAIAMAMSSPFGVGNGAFRTTRDRERYVDTLAYGAYRRTVFDRVGLFDEEFVRTQDAEFNCRLTRSGGKILLTPAIRSVYYSRATLGRLWHQYVEYGFWKARLLQKRGLPSRRHLVPPIFVLALAVALALAAAGRPLWLLSVAGSYIGINLLASIHAAARQDWRMFPVISLAFATIHFAFGLGFWKGIWAFTLYRHRRLPDAAHQSTGGHP